MYKGTGTGLIGLGVVLVVVGAILDYAVTATTSGLSIFSPITPMFSTDRRGTCSVVYRRAKRRPP